MKISNNLTKIILSFIGFLGIVIPVLLIIIFPTRQQQEPIEVSINGSELLTDNKQIDSSNSLELDSSFEDNNSGLTTDDIGSTLIQEEIISIKDKSETEASETVADSQNLSEVYYFKTLLSEVIEPTSIDFDKTTTQVGYSKKPHKLYWIKYEDIGVKIGIVQIDKENNRVIAKLTNSDEHFDNSNGKVILNWLLGDTKYFENDGRILKIRLAKLKKSGRGSVYFNIKSWMK